MKPSVYSKEYEMLRVWMKHKREAKGLTIRALAVILHRHHSVVGKLEQDRRRIDILELLEYCRAVEADPHEAISLLEHSLGNKKSNNPLLNRQE